MKLKSKKSFMDKVILSSLKFAGKASLILLLTTIKSTKNRGPKI